MFKDVFDKLCWAFLAAILISLAVLLFTDSSAGNRKQGSAQGKSLERELAYRARVELIAKIYSPVEDLRKDGNSQTALLKLDELIKKYPGEAHGHILQGEILQGMGVLEEAASA